MRELAYSELETSQLYELIEKTLHTALSVEEQQAILETIEDELELRQQMTENRW